MMPGTHPNSHRFARKYPNVPCPKGHNTYAKHHNRARYCPRCRTTYTHDGRVYVPYQDAGAEFGNEKWRALRWDNAIDDHLEWRDIEDKPDAGNMTPNARRRLLAAIDLIVEQDRKAAAERWKAARAQEKPAG